MHVRKVILIGVFSALSLLLYLVKIPFPLFPTLSYDLSDIPAFVLSVLISPATGISVIFIKNCLHYINFGSYVGLPMGQLANFLSGSILIYSVSKFYHRSRRFKISHLIVSGIVFLIFISLLNYTFILPVIMKLMGVTVDQYVFNVREYAPFVKNFKSLILLIIIPFNLIKLILTVSIGIFVSERLKSLKNKFILES